MDGLQQQTATQGSSSVSHEQEIRATVGTLRSSFSDVANECIYLYIYIYTLLCEVVG